MSKSSPPVVVTAEAAAAGNGGGGGGGIIDEAAAICCPLFPADVALDPVEEHDVDDENMPVVKSSALRMPLSMPPVVGLKSEK